MSSVTAPSGRPYTRNHVAPHADTTVNRVFGECDLPASSPRKFHPYPSRYTITRSSACERCRLAKSRCSRDRPHCERCSVRKEKCVYLADQYRGDPVRSKSASHVCSPDSSSHHLSDRFLGSSTDVHLREGPSSSPLDTTLLPIPSTVETSLHESPSPTEARLSSKLDLSQLLTAFFTHVYPTQGMSFVHRAQIFRMVEEGQASTLLIKSMCAVAARYLPNADKTQVDGGDLPSNWCQAAKIGILTDMDQLSTSKLAALLCILRHEFNSGRTQTSWMLTALAVRMTRALGLSLELDDPNVSWMDRESRRRLMWATFCADSFSSGGWPEYRLLRKADIHIRLPINEHDFALGIENQSPFLSDLLNEDDWELARGCEDLTTRWIWLLALRGQLLR